MRWIALLAASSLAACRPPASPTIDHLAWVPESASFVVGIDLDRLRASRWWSPLIAPAGFALMFEPDRGKEMKKKCGFDAVVDTHWMMLVLDATGETSRGALIVNASWTRDKVEACAKGLGAEIEVKPDGLSKYGNGAYIGWVAPDTLALTIGEEARPFVREIVEHKTTVRGNPVVERELVKVDRTAAVWVAGSLAQRRSPLRELGVGVEKPAVAVHGSLSLTDDARGEIVIEMTNAADASQASAAWTKLLADLAHDMPAAAGVTTSASGALAKVAVHIDSTQLDGVAKMVAATMRQQNDIGPPPPPPSDPPPPPPE